tara:strand:- start:212 stop:508 length:297 start_codon:yes stop_codon:yes gene_type:complete
MNPHPKTDQKECYFDCHDSSCGMDVRRCSDNKVVNDNEEYEGFFVPSSFSKELENDNADLLRLLGKAMMWVYADRCDNANRAEQIHQWELILKKESVS